MAKQIRLKQLEDNTYNLVNENVAKFIESKECS